tara:strand:+ start:1837 stop:2151 length:315 start_codon:yes stop_codon:yes gene_type:complete
VTLQVGEITAEGNWSVGYEGAYVGGVQYPYTCPYGDVDANSIFSSQKVTDGQKFRIVSLPSGGVLDAARAEVEGLWGNDINDIYTPPGGFAGPVTIGIETEEVT